MTQERVEGFFWVIIILVMGTVCYFGEVGSMDAEFAERDRTMAECRSKGRVPILAPDRTYVLRCD